MSTNDSTFRREGGRGKQAKLIFCDQVGELGVVTKWNTTWHPGRVCFMSVLWTPRMVQIPEVVSGQGGWDPRGGALQWMGVEGGARVWGCRITCAKWHHEWRRVSSKSHSWCHLAQVILHPQGLEPLPQPHSLEHPLPRWVETPLPWHHFRDLTHPRCPQNWHKTDETGCSGRVSFCDHPKFPDEGTSKFFVLDPILETLLPIFFTLWSSIQRQWPVRITSCIRHSQNAGNFFLQLSIKGG